MTWRVWAGLALALPALALAQTSPAPPPAAPKSIPANPGRRLPPLSPEGNAIAQRWFGAPDPQIQAIQKQQQALRPQIEAALAAPVIDVARVESLIRQEEKLQADLRARSNTRLIGLLRELPEPDRGPFLRALRSVPPVIAAPTKQQ